MNIIKKLKNRNIEFAIIFVSIIYVCAVVSDWPFIRGFYDPIFPSEWPYYYVNTWNKLWVPFVVFLFMLLLFVKGYRKYEVWNNAKKTFFWGVCIALVFMLHLSYVHFSRFGITVLFQRQVNPGMNGYFSSAVRIETDEYLKNFPYVIENLDQHARDHPPGSILLIKGVIGAVEKINVSDRLLSYVPVPDGEVKVYWNSFSSHEKIAALFLAFFYHTVGALSVLLIFFIARLYFNSKTSMSLSFLGGMIPSISFFALKFDPFYFLLFCITAYFFLSGFRKSSNYFMAGVFASINILFSYSILPGLAVLGLYFLSSYIRDIQALINNATKIVIGSLVPILAMLIAGYNSFTAFIPIVTNQAPRSYWQWFVYNPFDFFQYFGIPLSTLFFITIFRLTKGRNIREIKNLSIIFLLLFCVLVITGISRAEVGRIWLPLMLFPLIALGLYKKLTISLVLTVATLLFIQNIIMTEFWVPIW